LAKINPVKVKQEAERLEKAGRLDQAVVVYRQIVEDNPRDWNTVNKIGDLLARLNRTREAAQEYGKVADFYARDGFHVRAIAMWKKVNKLDTTALEPYLNLADLYAKQGLMMEAKTQYQIVVEEYVKRGRTRDAAEVLKKMAEVDPSDLKVRSRLAEIFKSEGNAPRAQEEHAAIAAELSKKGHVTEAVQVLEKGLRLDPSSARLRGELARLLMVQRRFDRAVEHLEQAREDAPEDPRVMAQLGEAYTEANRLPDAESILRRALAAPGADEEAGARLGRVLALQGRYDEALEAAQLSVDRFIARREGARAAQALERVAAAAPRHVKTLVKLAEVHRFAQADVAANATYARLAEVYIASGEDEQAASILEMLVSREPGNSAHRRAFEEVIGRLGGRRGTDAESPTLGGGIEEDFDLSGYEVAAPSPPPPPPSPVVAAPPSFPRAPAGAATQLGPADRDFIEEHLAEGRVFRKYGLAEKAIEQLEIVIARFPDTVEARREVLEIYKEKGLFARAFDQAQTLVEIYRLRSQPADLAWAEGESRELLAKVGPPPTPTPFAPALPPLAAPEASVEEEEEEIALDLGEEEETIQFGEEGEPPVEAPPSALLEVEPVDLGREAGASAEGLRGQAEGLSAELARSLAEIDQYVSLGFVDDARAALAEVAARYGPHTEVDSRALNLGLDLEARAEAAEPAETPLASLPMPGLPGEGAAEEAPPAGPGDAMEEAFGASFPPAGEEAAESTAEGGALADLFEPQDAGVPEVPEATALADESLAEIVQEFRAGVDRQLSREDYDTRYNLGIAYKEMGLVDEAIAEFQLAAKDERRLLECTSMLGLCFLEKGLPLLAVRWFEKGLGAQGRRPEEYQGLRYDLAAAHAAAGETGAALQLFRQLMEENADFRDVADRVRQLSGAGA
jgi:tetratricopeptide (TPR) repeat protein